MYILPYSAVLLASFILSHARHTVSISQNGVHSYLPSSSEPDVCLTPKCVISAADVLTSLDETVDPCDDFYRFACGGWLKQKEVSEDHPQIHVFMETQNEINRKLRELLESKYESSEPPFVKKLKDFYSTCADVDSIEKDGSGPLRKLLTRLGGWPVIEGVKWDESTFDWVDSLISLRKLGYNHKILLAPEVAVKSLTELVTFIHLRPPGKNLLTGADLKLRLDDPQISELFRLMVKAAKLLGADVSAAEKEMLEVLNFIIGIEKCYIARENNKYSGKAYRTQPKYHTVKELQEEVPQIPWLKYFSGLFNDAIYKMEIMFEEPDVVYVSELADLINSADKRVIANYIMMRAVLESAEFLSEEWEAFDVEVKKYFEQEADIEKHRWKKCLRSVAKEMGIALSSYYVRRYSNEESKDKANIFVKYLHKEFLKILEETDWMDDKTRKKAEEKANALEYFIGFPKELLNDTFMMKTYGNLTITTDSYLENVMASHKMAMDSEYSNLGMAIDLKAYAKFAFTAQVNAFYSSQLNSIIIPTGILQDAFYDKDRPNYLNFGAIGYIIGHEITHGFDNSGRRFDKDGKFVLWWDWKSDNHFRKKVKCLIDQYDNYTTDIGMKVNGEKTQNENIADNGGLKEAYRAYNSWIKDNGIEPTLPGLNYTQNQLFWLSAAHVWCSKYDAKTLRKKLLEDSHSPGRYRVIGPMSNLEEFSKDFKCSADSPMNRKYKCQVW